MSTQLEDQIRQTLHEATSQFDADPPALAHPSGLVGSPRVSPSSSGIDTRTPRRSWPVIIAAAASVAALAVAISTQVGGHAQQAHPATSGSTDSAPDPVAPAGVSKTFAIRESAPVDPATLPVGAPVNAPAVYIQGSALFAYGHRYSLPYAETVNRAVAFAQRPTGVFVNASPTDGVDIRLATPSGTLRSLYRTGMPSLAQVSPDGTQVAITSITSGDSADTKTLVIVDVAGTATTKTVATGPYNAVAWSGAGLLLASETSTPAASFWLWDGSKLSPVSLPELSAGTMGFGFLRTDLSTGDALVASTGADVVPGGTTPTHAASAAPSMFTADNPTCLNRIDPTFTKLLSQVCGEGQYPGAWSPSGTLTTVAKPTGGTTWSFGVLNVTTGVVTSLVTINGNLGDSFNWEADSLMIPFTPIGESDASFVLRCNINNAQCEKASDPNGFYDPRKTDFLH